MDCIEVLIEEQMRSKDRIQVQDSGVCGYDPLCQNLNKYKLNCLSEISEKNSRN